MKIKSLFLICYLSLYWTAAHAQNGWLPPVTFPLGTQLCDNSPWQLVFYDGFDGNQLSDQWHTYLNWDGQETSDWTGARDCNDNALFKDDNVFVSNGTCKILIKNETYSWNCSSCSPSQTRTKNLTTGTLCSYFHFNGHPNYFNSGKFEARIKFPLQTGTWCAFWVNHGGPVNEIDIAEDYGLSLDGDHLPKATYNLHAWGPRPNENNPYNLPNNAYIENTYPNQDWWNLFIGNWFNQSDWHVYTCNWDTAKIDFYVDNGYIKTIWKYYQELTLPGPTRHSVDDPIYTYKVYPTCNPVSGNWNITYGYPYANNSECNIRLSTGVPQSFTGNPNAGVYEIGRMEVDYVKAWQRHPEEDGHENLCNAVSSPPILSGPSQLCSIGTFTATPAILGGYWTTTTGTSVLSNSTNGNGDAYAQVIRTSNIANTAQGRVYYNYPTGPEGCPAEQVSKLFNCFSLQEHPIFVVRTLMGNQAQFQLFAPQNDPATDSEPTFKWNLSYAVEKDIDTQHYQGFGRFISSQIFTWDSLHQDYYLHWQVTATMPDGSKTTQSGYRTNQSQYGQQTEDSNIYFFDANISNLRAYEQQVYNAVGQTFMAPNSDSNAVFQMIEKVRAQQLAPYILQADSIQNQPIPPDSSGKDWATLDENKIGKTRIFPNPAGGQLNLLLGYHFVPNKKVIVKIFNEAGKLEKRVTETYIEGNKINISLSSLDPGVYLIKIQQGGYSEHYEFVKK